MVLFFTLVSLFTLFNRQLTRDRVAVFQENGERMPRTDAKFSYDDNIKNTQDASVIDLMQKRKRDHEYAETAKTKKFVYPKPYIPGLDGKGVSPLDKRRVFGMVLGYSSAYDMVDVMICRQSL